MRPLVSETFPVPEGVDHPEFRLRPLSEDHAALDFDAVMKSKSRLGSIFSGAWPEDVNSFEDNLRDIREHVMDARLKAGFTYTVLSRDETKCLGCIYIYPSLKRGFEAAVHYWVHVDVMDTPLESVFSDFVQKWIEAAWPFGRVAYPGRSVPWETWLALPAWGEGC